MYEMRKMVFSGGVLALPITVWVLPKAGIGKTKVSTLQKCPIELQMIN